MGQEVTFAPTPALDCSKQQKSMRLYSIIKIPAAIDYGKPKICAEDEPLAYWPLAFNWNIASEVHKYIISQSHPNQLRQRLSVYFTIFMIIIKSKLIVYYEKQEKKTN